MHALVSLQNPMTSLLRLLLAFVITLPLMAQDEPARGQDGGSQAPSRGGDKGGIRSVDVEVVEKGGAEGFDPETGAKMGFKLDKAAQIMTARGHCRFDGSVQPRRLLPGQSGRLLVTMMLEGDSVLASPEGLTVSSAAGSLALSAWKLLPATVGRIAAAYRGRPVYDNWAVIEGTVTMPTEARLGEKRNIVLQVELDLHSGSSAAFLGHFVESVTIPCEVGVTANPMVSGVIPAGTGTEPAARPIQTDADATSPTVPAPQATAANTTTQAAEVTDPVAAQTQPAGEAELGLSAELAPSVEESTKDNMLIVGGGAAVLILVVAVFLLRRR